MSYQFQPESGGTPVSLVPTQDVWVPVSDSGVDPNLLLFGFGVLALLGVLGLFAYLAHKKGK